MDIEEGWLDEEEMETLELADDEGVPEDCDGFPEVDEVIGDES